MVPSKAICPRRFRARRPNPANAPVLSRTVLILPWRLRKRPAEPKSERTAWKRTCPRSLIAGDGKKKAKGPDVSATVVRAPPSPTKIPSLPSRRVA